MSAFVIDVFEAGQEVWNTAEAENEADDKTPDAGRRISESLRRVRSRDLLCSIPRHVFSPGQGPLSADGAVDRRGSFLKIP